MCAVPSGSWGGQCPSVAPYVTGMGPTDGATAPPEGVHVDPRSAGSLAPIGFRPPHGPPKAAPLVTLPPYPALSNRPVTQ
jgi:hypothetical protein